MVELSVDQMINELQNANEKMDAIEESALNCKPITDFLNNYNEALQHWKMYT